MVLTIMAAQAQDKRTDESREKKLRMTKIIEDFIRLVSSGGFCGTLTIEVPAKDGQLGRITSSLKQFVD